MNFALLLAESYLGISAAQRNIPEDLKKGGTAPYHLGDHPSPIKLIKFSYLS